MAVHFEVVLNGAKFHVMPMPKPEIPVNRSGLIPIRKIKRPKTQKISYQLSVFDQGKNKRICYPTYEDALKAWKQYNQFKIRYAKSMIEYDRKAHIEHSQAKELAGQDVSLVEAVKFWRKYHRRPEKAPCLEDATTAFLGHILKLGRSKSHRIQLKSTLGLFSLAFDGQQVSKISSNQVLDWFLSFKDRQPETIRGYYSSLSNFFNYCKRRKWLEESPVDSINSTDLPTVPKQPKGVLTADQTAAMFAWLGQKFPKYIPWFALQAFAGIRNAEASRCQWEWLDFDHERIVLPGWTFSHDSRPQQGTKGGDDWVMQGLPGNLWIWLRQYRQREGSMSYPYPIDITAIRKQFAGLKDHPIAPWPHNALRHTFATMHISLSESADKTALLMRHRSTRKLYQNYLAEIVLPEEAERYFAIAPK